MLLVIALVEYLTSEEAGQPLGNSFAWPVGSIVNCHAGKAEKLNGSNGSVKANGHGNGVVKGYGNGEVKMNGVNGKTEKSL